MIYVYIALLLLLNLFWLFLVVLGLPGNWLMVLSAFALNWWQGEEIVNRWVLAGTAAIALLAELAEFVSGMLGAAKAGGSGWGSFGSLVGAVLGGILGTVLIAIPVVGSIIGVCAGAFAGAALFEWLSGRPAERSIRSGTGAAVGRLFGVGVKLAAGVMIWIILALAVFL